jgi:hypothetical protein
MIRTLSSPLAAPSKRFRKPNKAGKIRYIGATPLRNERKCVTPLEALHFGLNSPAAVVITGIVSPAMLEQAFQAVQSFRPMDRQQVATILAKTKEAAMTGSFELFKTSSHYDGTIKNPSWLGYSNG